MRKSLLLFVVILAVSVAVSGRADKDEKQSIAVSTIKVQGKVDESMGPLMTGLIVHNLLGSENLKVVQSQLTDEVLRVLEENMSDLCDQTECETEPGKFVQIQKLVAGELSKLAGTYILNLRIVDVETNTNEWSITEECSTDEQLKTMAIRASYKIRNHYGESLSIPAYPSTTAAPQGPAAVKVKEINPTEVKEASSGYATLYITTRPRGAKVYIDGARAGSADPAFQKRNLTPGQTKRITLKKENYHDTAFDVRLTPGIKKYENVELEPAFGTLVINSKPEGAVVTVAGKRVGTTPYRDDQMQSDKYLVTVQKELYKQVSEMVVVRDEQTTEKTYRLKENYGTLSVDSDPEGASIIVQGREKAKTPARVKLEPGTYKVTLEKQGHFPREFEITMARGKQARISSSQAKLEKKAGAINVYTDPPLEEVRVIMDGDEKGTAPLTLSNVPEGKHKLEVEKEGYHADVKNIDLEARETKEINFELKEGPVAGEEYFPEGTKGGPMVFVPGGEFWMGCDSSKVEECPSSSMSFQKVQVEGYYIDKYEVTNKQYDECVQAGACEKAKTYWRLSDDNLPVVGVNWYDAKSYCEWAGKRLPTEKEWEKAARGTDGKIYPWGDKYENGNVSNDNKIDIPGEYPQGASPYGAIDMAGNVWEWCSNSFSSNNKYKILRGGSWFNEKNALTTFYRAAEKPALTSKTYGFRCAMTP